MTDALKDHEGTVSVKGWAITNLYFADDIDGLAGEEEELAKLIGLLDKASTAYSMEVSAETTKLMTKQHQWHQHRDESKWMEAWDNQKLQVPGLSYNWWGFKARNTLQDYEDSIDNSSTDKAETTLEWQEYFSQSKDTSDVLIRGWGS